MVDMAECLPYSSGGWRNGATPFTEGARGGGRVLMDHNAPHYPPMDEWSRICRCLRDSADDLKRETGDNGADLIAERLLAAVEGRCEDHERCSSCPVRCWAPRLVL